ncbi:hydroxyacid dehydrogenase [Kutzneria sp. CA-103260]|uniref:hydroxyacid dehydrogenase n=1 Tax=Kutzneria sp. CA-103260 TaxID=2802641 RepID=UPI001BAA4A02|nr:hydroxyacid dehydrogenase [Kutzneria sp. CA-103260]QUQ65601.1 hydroxyacid dehydrogenase [Kutzneria sp. CA-103260]
MSERSFRRPRALLAFGSDACDQVFPPDLRAALAGLASVRRVAEFSPGPTLAAAEVIITGWGGPALDAGCLEHTPRLRLVVHTGGSVKEARITPLVWQRGIEVSSAAAVNAVPVAQYTVAAVLLAGKRAFRLAADYAGGRYRHVPPDLATGNAGRTVGVVGASRIGRLVLAQLREHGFRLLVSDPYLTATAADQLGAELVALDDLLAASDVVTLHAPLLAQTRLLIDDRRLGLMRDGAVLVNTARGGLVDTEALVRHCARIDAVLDVTEPEPLPPGHPLLRLPNVLVTPHIAGALGTEVRRLGEFAVAEIRRWLAGEPLAGAVRVEDLARIA